MTQLKSLLWKEWHEISAFLWIGLGVFLGLPALGGWEAIYDGTHRFEIRATPWVCAFGGVLAVFVAVGATTRDFGDRLPDFWQSRPVNIVRWLLVKYSVGLIVVQVACVLPLCVELPFNRDKSAGLCMVWFPFMWTAMYSLAFLAGLLIKRTAQAAMFGLAAMLLVYLLPLVLPPLEWMNIARLTTTPVLFVPEHLEFVAGMLCLAGISLALGLLAAHRDWRIDSGAKMMYGSVSAATLILFSSAAFQLGANLPILKVADLPNGETVQLIRCDGTRGYVITERLIYSDGSPVGPTIDWTKNNQVEDFYRTIEVDASGIKLGDAVKETGHIGWEFDLASTPDHQTFSYYPDVKSDGDNVRLYLHIHFFGDNSDKEVSPLWEQPYASQWPLIKQWHNRLYVIGTHLVTLDITEPLKPRIISDVPFRYGFFRSFGPVDKVVFDLPQIPALPARERLRTAFSYAWGCLDGDLFCLFSNQRTLITYRLTELTDASATFQKIGQYEPTILESVFGLYDYGKMATKDGLLYLAEDDHRNLFNPHVTVFDIGGPGEIRPIGHFAAPSAQAVCPLPDGRALIGGTKIWLVGPPPRRTNP